MNRLEGVFIFLMFGSGLGYCCDSFFCGGKWECGVGRVEAGRLCERKTLRGEGERHALEVD